MEKNQILGMLLSVVMMVIILGIMTYVFTGYLVGGHPW